MKLLLTTAIVAISPAIVIAHALAGTPSDSAQPAAPMPPASATVPVPAISNDVTLPSTGDNAPHVCLPSRWYPQSALRGNIDGITTVAFRIDVDGKPRNMVVKTSSGSSSVDRAAISCASDWKYIPAKLDGVPVEILWSAKVQFTTLRFPSKRTGAAFLDLSLQFCPGYPSSRLPNPKPTMILISVEADGSIANSSLVQSSGEPSLDQFTLTCTSSAAFKQDIASGQQTSSKLLFPIFWPKQAQ